VRGSRKYISAAPRRPRRQVHRTMRGHVDSFHRQTRRQ
jgi:hypothetical protein